MVRAAAILVTLALASEARAADDVRVEIEARGDCPGEAWFRERLGQRGLRGVVRASVGPEADGYSGDIEARTDGGAVVRRRLTGPRCATVAEGLVVVAEVHLAGLTAAAPRAPASAVVLARPEAPPPFARFAIGVLGTVDTIVTGDPSFGGGLRAWAWLGAHRMRGLAISVIYSRADAVERVPITYQHIRGRLDLIPFDLPLASATTLGFAIFLSGGALHASADVARSTPGARSLWGTGAGLRVRQGLGPLFAELGVDGTLAITRRAFEVTGIDAPLFSLPLGGVAATLSLGLPVPP